LEIDLLSFASTYCDCETIFHLFIYYLSSDIFPACAYTEYVRDDAFKLADVYGTMCVSIIEAYYQTMVLLVCVCFPV